MILLLQYTPINIAVRIEIHMKDTLMKAITNSHNWMLQAGSHH